MYAESLLNSPFILVPTIANKRTKIARSYNITWHGTEHEGRSNSHIEGRVCCAGTDTGTAERGETRIHRLAIHPITLSISNALLATVSLPIL